MDTFKDKQLLEDMYARGAAPWEVWKNGGSSNAAGQKAINVTMHANPFQYETVSSSEYRKLL